MVALGEGAVFYERGTPVHKHVTTTNVIISYSGSWDLSERGTTTAGDVQGTPTQSHVSPSILVYQAY